MIEAVFCESVAVNLKIAESYGSECVPRLFRNRGLCYETRR